MTENKKSIIYLDCLDQILAGEKDVGPVEDKEIQELLLLAKTMITAGFSEKGKIREEIKQQLLTKLSERNKSSFPVPVKDELDEDELDEEALQNVAAGLTGKALEGEDCCPFCGFSPNNAGGKCPICSR
ncbi:MAG: hypothetical protein WA118_04065 [Carboxydocellales bacterium]|jgi:rubrerythrin